MITIPEKFKGYSIEGKKYETNDYKKYDVTLCASKNYLEEDDDWFQYEIKTETHEFICQCEINELLLWFPNEQCELTSDPYDVWKHLYLIEVKCDLLCQINDNPYISFKNLKKISLSQLQNYFYAIRYNIDFQHYSAVKYSVDEDYSYKDLYGLYSPPYPNRKVSWIEAINNWLKECKEKYN